MDFLTFQAFALAGLSKILYCIVIIVVSLILIAILNSILKKLMRTKLAHLDPRKSQTISSVFGSVIKFAILFIAACSILTQFGISVASILTVAGIGSVAIAFGAQSLVKDIITGCFILLEDQYGIGDLITVDGVNGTVEEITLRTTSLRSWDGTLYIVPNGNIGTVANTCKKYINAIVDVGIDYGEDMDRVLAVLNDEMDKAESKIAGLKERPTVLGITSLDDSAVTVRILAKCMIKENFAVERALRLIIKTRLDAENISIPFPQRTVQRVKD